MGLGGDEALKLGGLVSERVREDVPQAEGGALGVAGGVAESLTEPLAEPLAEPQAEADRRAVVVCERSASAAGEALPAGGVPVPWVLAVSEGLAVAVAVVEGLGAAALGEARRLCEGKEEAVPVAARDSVGDGVRAVSVAAAEADTLGQAVWEAVGN